MDWVHDVELQKFKDQNSEDVCLRYVIPIKCIVIQVDPGAAWFRTICLAQASKVLTPPRVISEILTVVSMC